MKISSVLKSNHDLKKNGYKILRKLHHLEKKKGKHRAYAVAVDDTYFFVLSCRALVDIIKEEYPQDQKFIIKFLRKCDTFLEYLNDVAGKKAKIDGTMLAGFLRAYTRFFNRIIKEKYMFRFNQQIVELWNTKCLMAFVATWSSNN